MEYSDFTLGSIDRTLRRAALEMKWLIGRRTPNRNKTKHGDKALIFVAGSCNQKFVGHVIVSSSIQKNKQDLFDFVGLEEISVWEKQVMIRPLIKKLDFIKNKEHWGSHLQRGVVKISKHNYSLVASTSKNNTNFRAFSV